MTGTGFAIIKRDVSTLGLAADRIICRLNYQNITIQNTDYRRNDEFDIRKIEFEKALQAAKKKAEYMTQVLNTKISKVFSIKELSSENYITANLYTNERLREAKEDKSGYGNIKITAVVIVEFELE